MSGMAAPVSVRARLDSVQILMGKLTVLHLEAVQRKGEKGGFPMFSQTPQDGYVGVCGDSVELRTSIKRDTVDLGSGMIQINHSVPVQAFDSGTYRLPQFVYVSGRDTARSNSVALKVIPSRSPPMHRFQTMPAPSVLKDLSLIFFPTGSLTCGGFGCPSFCLPFCS